MKELSKIVKETFLRGFPSQIDLRHHQGLWYKQANNLHNKLLTYLEDHHKEGKFPQIHYK